MSSAFPPGTRSCGERTRLPLPETHQRSSLVRMSGSRLESLEEDALRVAMVGAQAADPTTAKQWPQTRAGRSLNPYYTRAVPVLAAGVLLVLAVLCSNASSLMLGRLSGRQREFAMRLRSASPAIGSFVRPRSRAL